jgi:hypothetical protein
MGYLMKKLIIGKNSKVVSSLFIESQIDVISHKNIWKVDFSNYDRVYLFSWSNKSLDDNVHLLNLLPVGKLTFISTTAVYSAQSKMHWSSYVKWKCAIEKIVKKRQDNIIRLGVCDPMLVKNSFGSVPFTSKEKIKKFLLSDDGILSEVNLFDIIEGGRKNFLSLIIYKLFEFANSNKYTEIFTILLGRVISFPTRSYTLMSSQCFFDTLQIGCGALGSISSHKNIIYSNMDNSKINASGFNGSIIGYKKNGLMALWHGVSIKKIANGFKKEVPLWVRRKNVPSSAMSFHVFDVKYVYDYFKISGVVDGYIKTIFSKKIILAAGSIENYKIINSIAAERSDVIFDDHDLICAGHISYSEAVEKKFIMRSSMGIVSPGFVSKERLNTHMNFMIDVRPSIKDKIINDDHLYSNKTLDIIFTIFKNFNIERLNQAFYNKFGVSLPVNNYDVYLQVERLESVILKRDGTLNRLVLSQNYISQLSKLLTEKFSSFKINSECIPIDAQHIVGGGSFYTDKVVDELLSRGLIKIKGDIHKYKLGAFHHTVELQKKC